LDAPTAVQTPPNDSVETPVVAEKPDLRWIEWSVAGAAVAAGLVMAFVNKKRITNPKTKP
jgi:hypothetical protein